MLYYLYILYKRKIIHTYSYIYYLYASPVTAFIIVFFSFFFFITDPSWNHKGESSDQVKTRLCIKRLRITHKEMYMYITNSL